MGRSHPNCWTGDHYEHTGCVELSGQPCIDCGKPAGTLWGPLWCPDCDVKRLDRISAQLAARGVWLDETHHFREASEIMSRAMSEFQARVRSQVLPAFADFASRVRALRAFLAPFERELLAEERRIRLRRRRMHHEYRRRRKGKW